MTTVKHRKNLKSGGKLQCVRQSYSSTEKQLVIALKKNGHSVAMTGDGVNDVLALKEADCSIAMAAGSDAARNVSQLVLVNNDFASMPGVVAEGRRTINNLERSSALYIVKQFIQSYFRYSSYSFICRIRLSLFIFTCWCSYGRFAVLCACFAT